MRFFYSFFICTELCTSLAWYFYNRWQDFYCTGYTPFFVLCETLVLTIGCLNICILIEGTRRFSHQCHISRDGDLLTHSEKIWHHLCADGILPSILCIVPTYNEDIAVLERTLIAVLDIHYPRHLMTIVVGDDGKNDTTKMLLSEKFPDVHYHRREKIFGHAKAGNINDILFASHPDTDIKKYDGDFIFILDCDMAPVSTCLQHILPLFYTAQCEKEEKCCFVQSPQRFSNIRGIDFLGQHYRFFYDVVLKAYSGFQLGVPCCGTNVVFDRSCLEHIGGIQTGSITEDFKTSLLLHSMGFFSRYCTQTTATGLSPTTLTDFYSQRERWAIGGLQIVFDTKFFERISTLPLVYKWIYTFSGASPILAFLLIVLLLGPVMDIFHHSIFLCGMSEHSYIVSFLPYSISYVICVFCLHHNLSWWHVILSFQESIYMIPFSIGFFCTFLVRTCKDTITFKPTPKTRKERKKNHACFLFFLLFPYIVYLSVAMYSIFFAKYIKLINVGWLIFISLQLLNPSLFFIQSLILT